MRTIRMLTRLVVVHVLWAGTALAQNAWLVPEPSTPNRLAVFDDERELHDHAGADNAYDGKTANDAEIDCVTESCGEDFCGPSCGSSGLGNPWRLPQPCMLQKLGIVTGGWFQGGITLNGEDPADRFNGPVLTNDRHGEFQMNQLWLYLDRAVDTSRGGFGVGGRIDLLYGTDWRAAYCHGRGFEDRINGQNQLYGFSVPQMYLEAAFNNLSVKMGRMAGILGYESVVPISNFFYSHAYTLCYGEPFLITGLMGKYQLSERTVVLGGFHQGVRRFEDNNEEFNFQGGLTWKAPHDRLSLAYGLDWGRNGDAGLREESIHSFVLKYQLTEKFLYVLQNDLGHVKSPDAEWYSISQYFLYTINPKWSIGARVEWFRDDDGTRIAGLGNLPAAYGWLGAPGYAGNFTDVTLGLNYKPHANVTLRPEVRWDWYDGLPNAVGPYPLPFDDGTSSRQFTLAMDLTVTF